MARLMITGAAAVLAVAALATVGAAEPRDKLEDVQIGEHGDILRVALICSSICSIEPGQGVDFRIIGVAANLSVDLASRSALAQGLTVADEDGASVVRLKTAKRVNEARVITCRSDTGLAPCIEYRFEPDARGERRAAHQAAPKPPPPAIREDGPAQAKARAPGAEADLPFIGAIILAPGPVLRDAPAPGILYPPKFGPPERLSPPLDAVAGMVPAKSQITPKTSRPSYVVAVDRAAALGRGSSFSIRNEAAEILGKSLDAGACEGARARLQADAWALDAMIDLAFCKAMEGKLEEADADFARLLAYTPDNYQALVGRALIAIAGGDREKGLALYQDALEALPPIAESDRIVEAMQRK